MCVQPKMHSDTINYVVAPSVPKKLIRAAFYLRNREGSCQTARCCPDCYTLCPYFVSFSREPFLSNQSPCSFQQQWWTQSAFFLIEAQSGLSEMELCPRASLMYASWVFHLVSLPRASLLTSPSVGKLEQPVILNTDTCSQLLWNL